jgi:hypothetical protein
MTIRTWTCNLFARTSLTVRKDGAHLARGTRPSVPSPTRATGTPPLWARVLSWPSAPV